VTPPANVTIEELFRACADSLQLHWLNHTQHNAARPLLPPGTEPGKVSYIGRFNAICPHRIQLIGHSESEQLAQLDERLYQESLTRFVTLAIPLLIFTDDAPPHPGLVDLAEAQEVAIFSTPLSNERLINHISFYLHTRLAPRATEHGVFLDVLGIGVLLTGEHAVGKSELALELINRGHRLVADDAPEFMSIPPDTLRGSAPELLKDFLEVRGLGLLNIRKMFGDNAIKRSKSLQLIIHLEPLERFERDPETPLSGLRSSRTILDVQVPMVTLPVAAGRNLSVLVEAAARNQILYDHGYDASADFLERHHRLLNANRSP